jgi:hypothetical protein
VVRPSFFLIRTLRVLTGLNPRPRICLEDIDVSLLSIALEILRRFHCRLSSSYISRKRRSSFLTDSGDSSILILSTRVCSRLTTATLSLFIAVKVRVSLSLMRCIDRGIMLCSSLYRTL